VNGPTAQLPRDVTIANLFSDRLLLETCECVLPGTRLAFRLVLEGNILPLDVETSACLVVARRRLGYVFHVEIPLAQLSSAERQIITLFIAKGRGAPRLERATS
jgi:hypothetical protein